MPRLSRAFALATVALSSFVGGCGEEPADIVDVSSPLTPPPGGRAILWEQPQVPRAAVWQTRDGVVSKDDAVGTAPAGWRVVGGGDFDKDGHGDVLWLDDGSKMLAMWLLQGSTFLGSSQAGPLDPLTCHVLTGDFNADGKTDILQTTCSVGVGFQSRVWITDGFGAIHPAPAAAQSAPSLPVATADFNNDGRSDIVFRNGTDTTIWTMNADGSHSTYSPGTATTAWDLVGAGDMDSDGIAELVWWNHDTGQTGTWKLSGPGTLLNYWTPWTVDLNWRPVLVADITGEGKADIVWRHVTNLVSIWVMDGPTSAGFRPGQPSGTGWQIRGVTPLAATPPAPPSLPAVVEPSVPPTTLPKILIVPCRFDDRPDETSIAAINDLVAAQIVPWFRTISYRSLTPNVTVAPTWYPLGPFIPALRWARKSTTTREAEVRKCVDQAANMYDLGSFAALAAVWNFDGDGTKVDGIPNNFDPAGADGKYVALGPSVFANWGLVIQELVHALGITEHSMSQDAVVYGDNWDVMSCAGCISYNLNSVFRKRLTGLPPNRFRQLTSSATVTLAALDRPDAPGDLSVEVDMVENGLTIPYFIEYHTIGALDFSAPKDAVLLHRATGGTSFLMGRVGVGQGSWAPGTTLTSQQGGLVVNVTSVAPVSGWAKVNVTKN